MSYFALFPMLVTFIRIPYSVPATLSKFYPTHTVISATSRMAKNKHNSEIRFSMVLISDRDIRYTRFQKIKRIKTSNPSYSHAETTVIGVNHQQRFYSYMHIQIVNIARNSNLHS